MFLILWQGSDDGENPEEGEEEGGHRRCFLEGLTVDLRVEMDPVSTLVDPGRIDEESGLSQRVQPSIPAETFFSLHSGYSQALLFLVDEGVGSPRSGVVDFVDIADRITPLRKVNPVTSG